MNEVIFLMKSFSIICLYRIEISHKNRISDDWEEYTVYLNIVIDERYILLRHKAYCSK